MSITMTIEYEFGY